MFKLTTQSSDQSHSSRMRYRFTAASGIALAMALAGQQSASAQAAATTEPDEKNTVVVTGVATATEYDKVGSSLTVVSGELIEDQGYSYVPDVLRQVPGVAVNRTGPFGGLTQVRIRGAEGNHTLVLLDGIDISSPDQGETDFSTLLAGDLQRVEVLRGPQSGLYGSNALAGVVNLITRRDVNGYYGYGNVEVGEMNTAQLQAGGGIGDGDTYGSIGLDILTTDGFDISPSTTAQGVPAVGVNGVAGDEEDNRVATVYVRGGKAFNDYFKTDAVLRYVHKDSGLDGQAFSAPISGRTYDDASRTRADIYLVAGSADLSLADGKWNTSATVSYSREERRGVGTSFSLATFPTAALSPNGADATRTKATVRSTYEFGTPDFVSYVTGFAEVKNESFKQPCETATACTPAQRPKQERDLTGIGGQYRAEIANQFYVTGTLRQDFNSKFDDATTYSVAGSWVIPNTGTRPHASYGTGVTNPTFSEQFGFNPGTFVGNPNLVPEEAKGYDIGIEQSLLNDMLVLDLTYFNSVLEKEIFSNFTGGLTSPANRTTESNRSGFEATLRYQPIDGLNIIGSYTNLDATEPSGATEVIEVRRPENQAALDATWALQSIPLQLNLGVTYNGKQTDTNFQTFLRQEQDPYTTVRLGASYAIDDSMEVYARIENLTDEYYEEVIGYGSMPRAVFFGFRIKTGSN